MDCFDIPFLETKESSPKWRSSPAASTLNEGQISLATAAVADDSDHDDYDWDLERAAGLNDIKRVGVKCRLNDIKNRCRAKKGEVPRTVTATFQLRIKLVNQELRADADPSPNQDSLKSAVVTAQNEIQEALEQLAFLQQKYNNLNTDLQKDFETDKVELRTEMDASCDKAMTADTVCENTWLAESERAE